MNQVWSDVLNRFVPEDKKDALEAYHQRITQGSDNERRMQQGAENASNQGMNGISNAWSGLKSLLGQNQ